LKAQKVRQLIAADFKRAFSEVDVFDGSDDANRGVSDWRQDV